MSIYAEFPFILLKRHNSWFPEAKIVETEIGCPE
jgi:hypothetical protein